MKAPGATYKRGKVWWIWYRVNGERVFESAETRDERVALSLLAQRRREIADGTWTHPRTGESRARTFADDWAAWLDTRDDVITHDDDIAIGRRYVLPFFGDKRTAEIEPADLLDFFAEMRRKVSEKTGRPLSKNTIRGATARLATFFRQMEIRRKVERSPFRSLESQDRPRKPTRHELDNVKRVFTPGEVETLISDERIPLDRRVLYALQFFTGTRFGEVAGLRWSDWNEAARTITIERQYGGLPLKGKRGQPGAPRTAPVHPELRAILEEWRREGFPAMFRRASEPGDVIVPARHGKHRGFRAAASNLQRDTTAIEIEPTEQTHAFRRAFKTIAVANGASDFWIERIIHNASGGVGAGYVADEIEALRRAVECIPVRRWARVIPLVRCDSAGDSHPEPGRLPLVSGMLTESRSP